MLLTGGCLVLSWQYSGAVFHVKTSQKRIPRVGRRVTREKWQIRHPVELSVIMMKKVNSLILQWFCPVGIDFVVVLFNSLRRPRESQGTQLIMDDHKPVVTRSLRVVDGVGALEYPEFP